MVGLKSEKGQAMVEFALVLPILIVLLCGIIDFGWIFSNQIAIDNASREAARYSAIHLLDSSTDDDAVVAAGIVNDSAPSLPSPAVTVTSTSDSVQVNVSSSIPLLTGITSTVLGKTSITLSSECTMRIEQ